MYLDYDNRYGDNMIALNESYYYAADAEIAEFLIEQDDSSPKFDGMKFWLANSDYVDDRLFPFSGDNIMLVTILYKDYYYYAVKVDEFSRTNAKGMNNTYSLWEFLYMDDLGKYRHVTDMSGGAFTTSGILEAVTKAAWVI